MKVIEGKLSQEVLDIVEPFATWFFEQDQDLINIHGKADKDEYYTDNEYLDYIEAKGHEGFPEEKYGIDLTDIKSTPLEYRDKIIDVTKQLNNFFGSQFNAVKMYYPKDGFMSWHNNHNVPGYNILMSYTKNGDVMISSVIGSLYINHPSQFFV